MLCGVLFVLRVDPNPCGRVHSYLVQDRELRECRDSRPRMCSDGQAGLMMSDRGSANQLLFGACQRTTVEAELNEAWTNSCPLNAVFCFIDPALCKFIIRIREH